MGEIILPLNVFVMVIEILRGHALIGYDNAWGDTWFNGH